MNTESFIPLTPAGPITGQAARVTIVSQAQNARPFRPLESAAAEKNKASDEPNVQIQRNGAEVTGIEIRCSCGRAVHLSCDYELGGSSNPIKL